MTLIVTLRRLRYSLVFKRGSGGSYIVQRVIRSIDGDKVSGAETVDIKGLQKLDQNINKSVELKLPSRPLGLLIGQIPFSPLCDAQ